MLSDYVYEYRRPPFFSLEYHFVYRPFMNAGALLGFLCSKLPDGWRAFVGRKLVDIIQRFNFAKLPTAEELTADNTAEITEKIRAAMDQVSSDGKRGGWVAGKAVLDAARKPGEALTALPEGLMVTVFMGLPGITTPQTSFLATQLLHSLKQKYYETGHPDYLFVQAVNAAVEQLRAADSWGGPCGAGVLAAIFAARKESPPPLGWRAREAVVLTVFQQTEEYRKFLAVDADKNVTLPLGDSYEEFAASMLTNAYGVYPF